MAAPATKEQSFAKLPNAAKAGLLLLLLALVSAAYYFALHSSLADDITREEARYLTLQNDLRAAQARQQEYLRLREQLAQREAADRQNLRVLPEKAEIAAFLQDLHRLAELSGLDIQLVEPRPEEAAEMYIRIPVNLSLSGKYHHVAKFFYNASRLERAINMENIQLTQPKPKDDSVVLKVDVLATTFRRPNAEEQAAAAQPAAGQPQVPTATAGAKR